MDRIFLYDTTLRDGQQTQGVLISYEDKVRIVKSLDHLNLLSKKVANNLAEKDFIYLIGEIGVGKTTFTRNIINYLQEINGLKATEVLSPTFNLLYEYDIKNIKILLIGIS